MRLFAVWRCSVLQIRRFYGGFQFIQPKKRSHGNNWELIPDFSFNCRTTLTWTWPDWKMKRFVKMSAEPSRWVMLWNEKGDFICISTRLGAYFSKLSLKQILPGFKCFCRCLTQQGSHLPIKFNMLPALYILADSGRNAYDDKHGSKHKKEKWN